MADYNVNMKQWNGTSFDNVLPLAYDAKQLGGQSLAEVKQWVQDNNLLLYTGQYTGTGTYGASNPVSIQFPFEPKLFIFPISANEDYPVSSILDTSFLTTSYKQVGRVLYARSSSVYGATLMARFSDSSRKKLQIYSTGNAANQSNKSGEIYYFAAIGGYDMGGATEFIITESGNFIVPRTGRYMLELYGGGGGTSNYGLLYERDAIQGGSSCQRYDSISLTAGDSIAIAIGVGGSSAYGNESHAAGTETSFGTYRVDGGGAADGRTATGGSGSGNLGTAGRVIKYSSTNRFNNNNGTFGSLYGVGGWGGLSSSASGGKSGTNGAVYLKYLGA